MQLEATQSGERDTRETKDFNDLLDDYERGLILSALERTGGHQRRAAELLGILPTTLCEKMKRLSIRGRRGAVLAG